MAFAEKLSTMRKQKGFTQEEMAKKAGVGIAQLRRYEGGKSSPTLEVIKNIAISLGVTTDDLIFDEGEGAVPGKVLDRKLLEHFELISKMNPRDKEALKTILESMILKSRLDEIMPTRTDSDWSKEMRSVVAEFQEGAAGYSDDEIDRIVDETVTAVREAKA